jgi:hypothetical protein
VQNTSFVVAMYFRARGTVGSGECDADHFGYGSEWKEFSSHNQHPVPAGRI